MSRIPIALSLLILAGSLLGAPRTAIPPGYRIEPVDGPEGVDFQPGGIAFDPDGTLLVCTRIGEVWKRIPGDGRPVWKRFAHGLHEPLGILPGADAGSVLVVQRSELTELLDRNGDGEAEIYRRVNGDWGFGGNYHEYAHGLARDSKGNLYLTLNLAHTRGFFGSGMSRPAPYRGWAVRIAPDGTFHPFASGLRSPTGVGINGRDELFVTDSQGEWMPTSPLLHVEEGKFYGSPDSLLDHPDFRGREFKRIPSEELIARRSPPAAWVPYGELANSPGQPVFDETGGRFGPFVGQIFFGDQTKSNVMRVALDPVGGQYQSAIFGFAEGLASGYIRGAFAPDGSFYMAQVHHGWGAAGEKPAAIERLVWDGKTIPFEMHHVRLVRDGFVITFTRPADPASLRTNDLRVTRWRYPFSPAYASKKLDETPVEVEEATLSPDGLALHIKVPLLAGTVYRIETAMRSAAGEELTNRIAWYTLNRLIE